MNAPPAAKADGASLALALAGTLSLGLPDPDYITMHPDLAGSTTTSAAGFQFNDRHGQDPVSAMHAWAGRFGVTVDVSAGPGGPATSWHQFDFTHAGVRIHAYAEIAAGAPGCPSVSPDGDACTEAGAHQFHYGPDVDGMRRMWTDADARLASPGQAQDDMREPGPSGDDPEPGSQAYADKYASRTVQRGLLDGGQLPRRVVSLDSRMGFVSRLDGAKVRTGGEL